MKKPRVTLFEATLNHISGSIETVVAAQTTQEARAKIKEKYPKHRIFRLRKVLATHYPQGHA